MDVLLTRLQADGLMDSTIIFIFADHGEAMPRGKTNSINLGYRVPFVIWFPEMYKHLSPWGTQMISDENICFVELAPSILSLVGAEIPDYMKGRPIMGDERKPQDKYIYMTNDRGDNTYELSRTISDGRYIYTQLFLPYVSEH